MKKLHEIQPREDVGRKTIGRYRMQYRATGFACLDILEGKQIDRVYCDYHDDFVVRKNDGSKHLYLFFQVKTKEKRNHQWTINELLGIAKKNQKNDKEALSKIRNSIVGKMLLHTVNFPETCLNVSFLTNVQFDDQVENLIIDLKSGASFTDKNLSFLADNFLAAFEIEGAIGRKNIESNLRKISLEPGVKYLSLDGSDFVELAKSVIFRYSEIDLEHIEAIEIIESLINLVERKSFNKIISEVNEKELDDLAGIGIEDLLKILSISRGVYQKLLQGGDLRALKNASILQRKLTSSGATSEMVEFCTQQKIEWDIWLRSYRHSIPEFELNFLIQRLNNLNKDWVHGRHSIQWLGDEIKKLHLTLEHHSESHRESRRLFG